MDPLLFKLKKKKSLNMLLLQMFPMYRIFLTDPPNKQDFLLFQLYGKANYA